MKKKFEKPVRADTPLIIVDLHDRVPGMTDEALGTLHANALRLVQSGTERQRASADALMPAIESELAERHAKALANPPVRKRRAPVKKVKVVATPPAAAPTNGDQAA
jgi:hypothetical protein